MTSSGQTAKEGLAIVGPVIVGLPAPRGGYATTVYGNTQPQAEAARWLQIRPDSPSQHMRGRSNTAREYGAASPWRLRTSSAYR